MTDATIIIIVGAIQGVATLWVNSQIKRNSCSGEKCTKALKAAIDSIAPYKIP